LVACTFALLLVAVPLAHACMIAGQPLQSAGCCKKHTSHCPQSQPSHDEKCATAPVMAVLESRSDVAPAVQDAAIRTADVQEAPPTLRCATAAHSEPPPLPLRHPIFPLLI
jgi:hypothetical protein